MSKSPVALDEGSPEQPPGRVLDAASAADNDKTRFRVPPPAVPREVSQQNVSQQKAPTSNPSAPTGSGWGDPALWADAGPVPGVGSVINNRFVLEESIGAGGMGTVFKSRDLRKVEAQDRNPHVAIKVLNEEFRRHPQALQALQRESRKTQKLAHPNIVTVYDFDRDGANVYMVMELLEGEPLDRLIRRNEGLGLGVKEALRLTQGICRAMAHAHEQGIVHADFKPANAFLTRDNVIKVLDFGIARAVQHTEPVSGVMTVFDPGTLGALTPAYAGCEVIEGEEPDARDDIYAIACVAYELFAGRHPFDRLSAEQARDAGLNPEAPRGLSKRQWRTLKRGLSFRREQRPKSVSEFFDGLRPLRRLPAVHAAAGGAAIAVVAVLIMLTSGQIEKYHQHSLARVLASADTNRIEPLLPELRQLDPGRRASLFLDERARTGFAKYFESRMDALVDSGTGHYDYPGAAALLAELEEFLPDSQAVQDIRDRLNARKSVEITRERTAFDFDLQRGWLLPQQNQDNIQSLLDIVRHADPQSALLHDPRLPGAFADQANKALQRNDAPLADTLVKAGLVLTPDDTTLTALRDQISPATGSGVSPAVSSAFASPGATPPAPGGATGPSPGTASPATASAGTAPPGTASADTASPRATSPAPVAATGVANPAGATTASAIPAGVPAPHPAPPEQPPAQLTPDELRAQIQSALTQPTISLPQARVLAADIEELTRQRAPDAKPLELQLRTKLAQIAAAMDSGRGLTAALEFTEGAYALFPESKSLRETLIKLRIADTQRSSKQHDALVAASHKKIEALLLSSRIDNTWGTAFDKELQRLTALVPENDSYLLQVKARAALVYVEQAAALREQQRFADAGHMLELSRKYAADSVARTDEEKSLAAAIAHQEEEARQREHAAQVGSLEKQLLDLAQSNDVDAAVARLGEIRVEVPANDSFVTRDGPVAVASAFLRLAAGAAQEGRFPLALDLVNRGRAVAPSFDQINAARTRYSRYQAIDQYLTSRVRLDVRDVRSQLAVSFKQDPNEATAAARGLLRNFIARINSTHDPELAARLLQAAREIFGEQSVSSAPVQSAAPGSR
jgi:serine/threonine protein kinase